MPQPAHHLLIVGAGSIGLRHLRCFLATERTAISFVEPRDEIRASIKAEYPAAIGYASLEGAIDSAEFDGAVIATPAPMHVPQSLQLLERGFHLLIEKPLTLELKEAEALAAAAEKSPAVIGVAYVYRANPVLSQMRDAIRSGEYGRPLELIAYGGQNFPTYRPAYRDTYYRDHASGGGAIQDALTHLFNAGQWLVGDMQKIVVDADHLVLDGVEVEDTVHAIARYEEGVMATYTLNQHQAANEMTFTVVCERGVLRWENHQHRWRVVTEPDVRWKDCQFEPLQRDELFIRQANAFLDAMEEKSAPLCSLTEGIATLRANIAALESWRSGAWRNT
ncbi:Gfo/Idh/MocA family oxidoreductase [Blastopirellula sp. JC732]|uniref:Gfo/Idh/MocA family oxidoreductase n=1 Tax=Blastopirellula sediminis TaxID=2894196 RepID=A0A9X1MSB6_9BACT|nr:Gfo/Idh/MocA family oxidoreductase [Blastopirellula sediminis]MCC9605538.1 Gfo/Idh/MocA family oxidoreductase [Blastopirellula sediminis]MCC9631162.1 Gfo/Idh/MocA family oxidoreductase [Blastopirellula sediminis]